MDADTAVNSADETAALLAGSPFAERYARGAATIVAGGQPPRVLFANPAALTLFAAADLAALEARLFSLTSPGARRLTGIAEAAAAGPPRVELLRFWLGRRPLPLALLCGKIGDRLVLATPPGPDEIRAAAAGPPPEPLRAPPPRRFLWRLDSEERFCAVDQALAAAFGDRSPQAGETLAAFRARAGFDPDGKLADALAARRTFAALPTSWGEEDSARVALMSGAPEFDRERSFSGWRGFGLFADQAAPSEPGAPPPRRRRRPKPRLNRRRARRRTSRRLRPRRWPARRRRPNAAQKSSCCAPARRRSRPMSCRSAPARRRRSPSPTNRDAAARTTSS